MATKRWCLWQMKDDDYFQKVKCGSVSELKKYAKKNKMIFVSEPSWGDGIKGYYTKGGYQYWTEMEA